MVNIHSIIHIINIVTNMIKIIKINIMVRIMKSL